MPEAFPSCFGEYKGTQGTDKSSSSSSSSKMTQNLITCLYQTKLAGICRFVTITWCKNLMGQGLSVHVNDPSCHYMCKVDMKPWFFWKKQGSKSFDVKGQKLEVFWDLTNAKYVCGPEPQECFYVALMCEKEIILLLGDMHEEAYKKTHSRYPFNEPTLLSRREHVFGKKYYTTKAQFGESGRTHDIVIECHTGGSKEPRLYVRVDKQVVLQVKHLIWKFRGNQTIEVDGTQIQVFWDVHNWLFNPSIGHAVFMFQTSSCTGSSHGRSSDSGRKFNGAAGASTQPSPPSVLQWPPPSAFSLKGPEKTFFKSSSSSSSSSNSSSSVLQWASMETDAGSPSGFSLLLYAWKSE
uniref:TSA: Wollemia nobilis Ref_Wollemi_Transcript_5024_1502 transcribed RNA sequence n=1 Tax=Wollemia nobilis TaxID=56998 RepID=A0A0C9RXW3_9CONI